MILKIFMLIMLLLIFCDPTQNHVIFISERKKETRNSQERLLRYQAACE